METEIGDMPDVPVDGGVDIGDAPDMPVDGGADISEPSPDATGDVPQETEQGDLVDGSADGDAEGDHISEVDGEASSAASGEDHTDAAEVKALEQQVEALKAETYAREADELASMQVDGEASSTATTGPASDSPVPEQPATPNDPLSTPRRLGPMENAPEDEPLEDTDSIQIESPEGGKSQTTEGGGQGKEGKTVENPQPNKSPEGINPPLEWRPGKEG
jgi:hypothetical protein